MFSGSADLYDLIYFRFKDYAAEAEQLAGLLRERHRHAVSLLDVACGTGGHARLLTERYGYLVDGLDLSPDFVRIAAPKLPGRSVHQADMTDFDLGCTYDAILCLFSSIGYVRTVENVQRTLRAFRRHLAPGGIVIIEPWLTPEAVRPGHVSVHTAERDGLTVCRMSHMEAPCGGEAPSACIATAGCDERI